MNQKDFYTSIIKYYGAPANPVTESILLKWVKTCPIPEGPALLKLFDYVVSTLSNQYKRLPSNKELNDILDGNRHELDRIHREFICSKKSTALQIEDTSYIDKAKVMADKLKKLNEQKVELPNLKFKSVED